MVNKSMMDCHSSEHYKNPDFLIDYSRQLDFGEIHYKMDLASGMIALIAIHNTNLGPALGGCRYKEYGSLNEALFDVMRLARGMSYKSALAGMPLGGGKAVIMKMPNQENRRHVFEAFGEFVEHLNGRYITAVDSGSKPADMDIIATKTRHVSGIAGGDPSPYTAMGVRQAILAAAKFKWQKTDLDGIHIAIQGVGNVGYYLARELKDLGAQLTITDVSQDLIDRAVADFGCAVVSPEQIYDLPCDIFAPCALGAILNDQTIARLNAKMIFGAANNQLALDRHGNLLSQRGILYGPDYVINAGGVIQAGAQYLQIPLDEVLKKVELIYDTTYAILERAQYEELPTHIVADRMAEERLNLKSLKPQHSLAST